MKHDQRGALILESGEGLRLEARGSEMFFKAVSATTHGRFSLMERTLPPSGRMPPPHVHIATEEAYFILEGTVTFLLGPDEAERGPGTFVLVPGGVAHTIGNTTDRTARLLVLHAPALDDYFQEPAQLWSGAKAPSREQELELMQRHGMKPAG